MHSKTAIVTGAARGIGRASAEKLARDGFHVVLLDLDQNAVEESASEIGKKYDVKTLAYCASVTDFDQVKEIVADAETKLGNIEVLVNNAGIVAQAGDICDTSDVDWDNIFDVNLLGCVNCIKAVLPLFKERRRGRIINMGSVAGQKGTMAVSLAYGASKAAVINLTKSLSTQLASYNINVNAVAPGMIVTDMTAGLGQKVELVPLGRFGEADDVAGAVAFLAGEDSSYITGLTIDVNGGMYLR